MRLARYHRINLVAFTLFLMVLLGIWFVMYTRSKGQFLERMNSGGSFDSAVDALIARPVSSEELLTQKNENIGMPYNICYYNDPNDPLLWFTNPYEITASSAIIRMTRPIPIDKGDPCTGSSTPTFDFRTDRSTVNEGFNQRADEIIKLFLESVYRTIVIQVDTIVKNINYSPTTSVYQLSVACVYLDSQSKYNVLVNQFRLLETGELSNDPPQSLSQYTGIFNQTNRKGVTQVRDTRTLYAFLSGRSTSTITVEIFTQSGYNNWVGTLILNNITSQFIWVEIPNQTTRLYLRVSGGGTMQLDHAFFFTFPTESTVTRTAANYVLTPTAPTP